MVLKIKTIVATDIVNFTVKSSLLPFQQFEELLKKHDEIIKNVEDFWGKIIKNVWDGYLIFFETPSFALKAIQKVVENLNEYNLSVEDELHKINLRIVVNIWEVLVKKTLTWNDYFSSSLNLTYRVLSITPPNNIYLTENIYWFINKWEFNIDFVGYKKFKGIWWTTALYKFNHENKENLVWKNDVIKSSSILKSEELDTIIQEVDEIIFKLSAVAAVLSIQPIPIISISLIFFLQVYMTLEIAKIYSIPLSKNMAYSLVWNIIWILWFEYTKSWGQVELTKIWFPWIWWYIQAPLAFSLVYSFWKIISYKFYYDKIWEPKNLNSIKKYFIDRKIEWIEVFKKRKKEILDLWKKEKNNVMLNIEKIKDFKKKN